MFTFKKDNPSIYFQKQVIDKFEVTTNKLIDVLEKYKAKGYIKTYAIKTLMANSGYGIYISFLYTDKIKTKPKTQEKLESLKNTIYLYPGPYFHDAITQANSTIQPKLLAKIGPEPQYDILIKKPIKDKSIDKAIEKFFQTLEDYINNF